MHGWALINAWAAAGHVHVTQGVVQVCMVAVSLALNKAFV